jgi:hypothetical protein
MSERGKEVDDYYVTTADPPPPLPDPEHDGNPYLTGIDEDIPNSSPCTLTDDLLYQDNQRTIFDWFIILLCVFALIMAIVLWGMIVGAEEEYRSSHYPHLHNPDPQPNPLEPYVPDPTPPPPPIILQQPLQSQRPRRQQKEKTWSSPIITRSKEETTSSSAKLQITQKNKKTTS